MNQQGTMQTRSTRKAGTPAKKSSKTTANAEATDQPANQPELLKVEPEINLEVQIQAIKGAAEATANGDGTKLTEDTSKDVPEEEGNEEDVEMDGEEGESGESEEEVEGEDAEEEEEKGEEEEEEADEDEEADAAEENTELQETKEIGDSRHSEVFIGGLPKDTDEDDIKKALEKVGEVVEVRLIKDAKRKQNKGFAFARFRTPEQASRAATEFKRIEIKDKSCEILPNEHVLFLGNINYSWKKEQVQEKLKEYGIEGIEEMILMENPEKEGENRGFALLEFNNHENARKALLRLSKRDAVFGREKSARVHWGYRNEPSEVLLSQVKSVFVDDVPASWTKEVIQEHFGKYGEVQEIGLTRTKKQRYAVVEYATREAAIECVNKLNDTEIVDKEDKVKLKIKLDTKVTRPRNRKRPLDGHLGRGDARPGKREKVSVVPRKYGTSKNFSRARDANRGQSRTSGQVARASTGRTRVPRLQVAAGVSRPSRISRLQRGDNYRREEVKLNRRQTLGYRNRYDDTQNEFSRLPPENIPRRYAPVRRDPLPPLRRSSYLHADRDSGYGRDVHTEYDRDYHYGEFAPGEKRPYAYLEGETGLRRAQIDSERHPSKYDSPRVAAGRYGHLLNEERAPLLQSSLRAYDQPSALGATSFGGSRGLSSVYGSADYASSVSELRGAPASGGYLGAVRGYYY